MYLPILIWLLIFNNFTDINKAKYHKKWFCKFKLGIPWEKKGFAVTTLQNANCSALQVNRYNVFPLSDHQEIGSGRGAGQADSAKLSAKALITVLKQRSSPV